MKMIWKQWSGITRRLPLFQDQTKVLNKVMAILVILKYLTALDTPRNNMVQRSCGVNAGLSGHVRDNIKTIQSR